MTKCTASWEPSDVSFRSNKALKMGGDHFTPPPYQTRVNSFPCACYAVGVVRTDTTSTRVIRHLDINNGTSHMRACKHGPSDNTII